MATCRVKGCAACLQAAGPGQSGSAPDDRLKEPKRSNRACRAALGGLLIRAKSVTDAMGNINLWGYRPLGWQVYSEAVSADTRPLCWPFMDSRDSVMCFNRISHSYSGLRAIVVLRLLWAQTNHCCKLPMEGRLDDAPLLLCSSIPSTWTFAAVILQDADIYFDTTNQRAQPPGCELV